MAWQLRELALLPRDPGSIPSTYSSPVMPVPGHLMPLTVLWLLRAQGAHAHTQEASVLRWKGSFFLKALLSHGLNIRMYRMNIKYRLTHINT